MRLATLPLGPSLATLLALAAGCGDDAQPAPAPEPPPPAAEVTPVPTGYEIHEWGLIGTRLGGEGALMITGPGHFPAATAPGRADRARGDEAMRTLQELLGDTIVEGGVEGFHGIGKPVIYVHLAEGSETETFTARVRLSEGGFPEHWPDAEITAAAEGGGTTLDWGSVTARRGACTGLTYPAIDSERCTGTGDELCEAAELSYYETGDAACLEVGGARANHLFYRGVVAAGLPLELTREDDVVRVRHPGTRPIPGALLRVIRGDGERETRVSIQAPPTPGQTVELGLPDTWEATPSGPADAHAAGVASLREGLESLGLSPAERDAFMRAWEQDLLGSGSPVREVRPGEPQQAPPSTRPLLAPAYDAVLYFMPVEDVDAVAALDFEPAPTAVRRAMLVRVELAASAWPVQETPRGAAGSAGTTGPTRAAAPARGE